MSGLRGWARPMMVAVCIGLSAGCEYLPAELQNLGGPPAGVPDEVKTEIKQGEFGTARTHLEEAAKTNPTDVDTAVHLAFTQLLARDFDEADATLRAAEEHATPEQLPGIKLRRALIGLQARDMDAVRDHGKSSELPEGLLLAAEVHVQELEPDPAREIFERLQNEQGAVGATAKRYLQLLNGTPEMNSLAEVTALWALGHRKDACESAAQVVPNLADDDEKSALLLLWAGRAASTGELEVANTLLAEMLSTPSPEQSWRVPATKAIIAIAEGEYKTGFDTFKALEGAGAPADGLADARATAAALADDAEVARQLVGDLESPAVSRGLVAAGATDSAREAAPSGSALKRFMEK